MHDHSLISPAQTCTNLHAGPRAIPLKAALLNPRRLTSMDAHYSAGPLLELEMLCLYAYDHVCEHVHRTAAIAT